MITPEEYWETGEWKKAKPSIEDWFEFTKAYSDYVNREQKKCTCERCTGIKVESYYEDDIIND